MRLLLLFIILLSILFPPSFISSLLIKPFYFEGIDISTNAHLRYSYFGGEISPRWQIYWEKEGGKLWRLWMPQEGPSGTCPSLLSLSSSSPTDYLSSPLPLSLSDFSQSTRSNNFNKNNTKIIALPFFPSATLSPVFATYNHKNNNNNNNNDLIINWIGGYYMTNFTSEPDDFHPFILTPPLPDTCLENNNNDNNNNNNNNSPIMAIKNKKHNKMNKNKNKNKHNNNKSINKINKSFDRVGGNNNVPNCADIKSLYWYISYNVYPTHPNPTASACDYSCSNYKEIQDTDWGVTGTDGAYICTPSNEALKSNSELPTIVAFSGSANTEDWLEDFNIIGTSQFDMTVHSGFYHKFTLWQSYLESFSSSLLSPSTPILFTGHSMGAAVANVAAVYWKNRYPSSSVSLQTFGCPSVFQKPFSSLYQSIPNIRYVNYKQGCNALSTNEQDPVPVVAEIASYYHPVEPSALTETCTGWSDNILSIIPIIGDIDFSLHVEYGEFTDEVDP